MIPFQERVVPDAGLYAAPVCPMCATQFVYWRGRGGQFEEWRQGCHCPSNSGIAIDGLMHRVAYFDGARIGTPKKIFCLICRQSLATGDAAIYGMFGASNAIGYAHPACHAHEQSMDAAAQAARVSAGQGVGLVVYFGIDHRPTRPAPKTGHRDGLVRVVPAAMPALPEGSVVYEDCRRPLAKVRIAIPAEAHAEAWWREATANADAAYELHWFGVGAQQQREASRTWKGRDFSEVESLARIAELEAQPW